MFGRSRGGRRAGVALVHERERYRFASYHLERFRQGAELCAFRLVGRAEAQGWEMSMRVDREVDLRTLAPLGAVASGTRPALELLCSVRPSRATALGVGARSSVTKSNPRKSCTSTSNHQVATQRTVC